MLDAQLQSRLFATHTEAASARGFKMPAEWEEHERTWMMWPTRTEVWSHLAETKQNFATVANAIVQFEPVTMLVSPSDEAEARSLLGADVHVEVCPLDDSWARDAGPNFLLSDDGQLGGAVFRFNAWGEQYVPYARDALVAESVLRRTQANIWFSELVAEGGAISVDGEGTLITTESCLLNTNRNPGWSKDEVTQELCRVLGVEKVIWLPGNDDETETNGHVDGIAQFVRPGLVLMETSFDTAHPWYDMFKRNIDALSGQMDAKGRKLDVVLIEDGYGCSTHGEKFCTSYINSYLVNGAVIMPKYGIATDDRAAAVYRRLYPEREIVQVCIDAIAEGGGGIHCITQQQPRVRSRC